MERVARMVNIIEARKYAHKVFDQTWRSRYQRVQAYAWLARQMKLSVKECHIGRMTVEQCEEVVRLIREYKPIIEDRKISPERFKRREIR